MRIETLPLLSREALFAQLTDADPPLVLCVAQRLAQHLFVAHAQWQAARGVSVWKAPAITTVDDFIADQQQRQRLRHGGAAPLSAAESELLWRLVVAESREELGLLRETDAARAAAQAWNLCHDHALDLPLPELTPEVATFNRWAERYRRRCERLARPDASLQKLQRIASLPADSWPPVMVLAGFDRLPPWIEVLTANLAERGCTLMRLADPQRDAQVEARCMASAEQELRAAAMWVRERALRSPQARIGVVVPDLQARRDDLLRVFDQILSPPHDSLHAGAAARPYNLSLGAPLTQQAMVQCALQLLQLGVDGLDLPAAGALLCSPFWGDEDERLQRAQLDRLLRAEGHLQVDTELLQRLAPTALRARLAALERVMPNRRAALSDWSERFSGWLDAAGWPGARALDSHEYQVLEAWRALLAELAALGDVLGPVPASAALAQLGVLASTRVFQPQTPAVNVQVLGALEAVGLEFDALWVMGLDDERWPPAGRPNPYIPFELQRSRGMPHASTAQELAWAEGCTRRWREAAAEVVFSWPEMDGDRPLAPSPLIREEAGRAQRLHVDALPPHWRSARAQSAEERVADAYAPAPDLTQPLPGGARLLGDHASCPFRAWARHRLGAAALDVPGYGPTPIDRGQLVHRALEQLWRDWRDHARFAALDDQALGAQIADAVDAALDWLAARAPQRLPPALRVLEAQRLRQLLADWLAIERARAPFVIEQIEGAAPDADAGAGRDAPPRRFGSLLLRLRPDRVDRLEDGRRLVIDYKTGLGRKPPWRDARPEEPQLALYALTETDVAGIAYARLRAGQIGFDGIAEEAALAPGLKDWSAYAETRDASGWSALFGRWRGELETLAGELQRGLASVTPKHPRQSCRDCDLHALCRIREVAPEAAEDETEA
jgi:ATP-dependent helicase/nuclease subunit B